MVFLPAVHISLMKLEKLTAKSKTCSYNGERLLQHLHQLHHFIHQPLQKERAFIISEGKV
jgi:hypothetical protein